MLFYDVTLYKKPKKYKYLPSYQHLFMYLNVANIEEDEMGEKILLKLTWYEEIIEEVFNNLLHQEFVLKGSFDHKMQFDVKVVDIKKSPIYYSVWLEVL